MKLYSETLLPFKNKPFKLLEIGIADGDSLIYWKNEYPFSTVVGLDVNKVTLKDDSSRIICYQGEQQDTKLLTNLANEQAPDGFDVIIDDGSHIGHYTKLSFWHLFNNHLKPGGLYFIEDWGTSYWDIYPDGKRYKIKKPGYTFFEKVFYQLGSYDLIKNNILLSKIVKRLRFLSMRKKHNSHLMGMVGFIKELVDECGVPDITDEERGHPPKRSSSIDWVRVSTGIVLIKKPQ